MKVHFIYSQLVSGRSPPLECIAATSSRLCAVPNDDLILIAVVAHPLYLILSHGTRTREPSQDFAILSIRPKARFHGGFHWHLPRGSIWCSCARNDGTVRKDSMNNTPKKES